MEAHYVSPPPDPDTKRVSDPLVILGIAILGAALVPFIVIVAFKVFRNFSFSDHPEMAVWLFLVGLETALWALVVTPLWGSARELWRYCDKEARDADGLVFFTAGLLVLAVVPLVIARVIGFFTPLNHQFIAQIALSLIGYAVAAGGVRSSSSPGTLSKTASCLTFSSCRSKAGWC